MRIFSLSLAVLVSLSGCAEVLRQPTLEVNASRATPESAEYDVTRLEATVSVIAAANRDPFVRLVNVGGAGGSAVKRLPEQALFNSGRDLFGTRPSYRIGVGDVVSILRTGNASKLNGIVTREVLTASYVVDERGAINLNEGREIAIAGLTIKEAQAAVSGALSTVGSTNSQQGERKEFPTTPPTGYRIGPGDQISVSRVTNLTNTNGDLIESVERTNHVVGADGVVSILRLGDIEVAGRTLAEVRELVIQEAVRNAAGADVVVDIREFASQSILVTGDLGTSLTPITDQPLSYDRLFASLNPALVSDADFLLRLERGDETYVMSARELLLGSNSERYFAFDGDRLTVSQTIPSSDVRLQVSQFASKSVSYVRVRSDDSSGVQPSQLIPIDIHGLQLSHLLTNQRLDINNNRDALVRIIRGGREYRLSAQSVLLDNPSKKVWLRPDDHVVVEDIAYVGDTVLLVGELRLPRRLPLDRHTRTTLSEALFNGGVFATEEADFRHVYVLRGEGTEFDAYHFDISKVLNLTLAERFELRPGDIMFVRTRPLTEYNRVLALILSFGARIESLRNLGDG